MATVTVNLAEWDDFKRDLTRVIKQEKPRIIRMAGEQVGLTFDDFVKDKLPPQVRKLKVADFWTLKQRRWWWATMAAKADGKSNALPGWNAKWKKIKGRKTLVISGSYKRSGLLPRSLDFEIEQSSGVMLVRYGTNVQYAKWVIDLDNQSKYHAGNWPTLQALAVQATPLLRETFADVMFAQIEKRLKG